MSFITLIIGILALIPIFYIIRFFVRFARTRGISKAAKILLPTALVVGVPGTVLIFLGYIEIGMALTGLAGAMTLVEAYLRHKAERHHSQKEA